MERKTTELSASELLRERNGLKVTKHKTTRKSPSCGVVRTCANELYATHTHRQTLGAMKTNNNRKTKWHDRQSTHTHIGRLVGVWIELFVLRIRSVKQWCARAHTQNDNKPNHSPSHTYRIERKKRFKRQWRNAGTKWSIGFDEHNTSPAS